MGEPIGGWNTDTLRRWITQSIASNGFPTPKSFKLDSVDVNDLVVRGKFQHKMEAPIIIQPAGAGQPNFQNTWTNTGAGFLPTAMFWKDPWGMVHFHGTVGSPAGLGTGNKTVMVTLPIGYRPLGTIQIPQRVTSGAADFVGFAQINTAGAVTMGTNGVAANAVITNMTFEGSFRT